MAETKNFPSLPPNYVSILHLQAIQEAKKHRQKQEEDDRKKAREEQSSLEEEAERKRIEQEQDDRNNKATCEAPDSKPPYTVRSFRNRRRREYNRRKLELSRTNPDAVEEIGAESEVIAGIVYNRREIEANRTNPDEVEEAGAESDVIVGNLYDRAEKIGVDSGVIAGTVYNRRKLEATRHTSPDEDEENGAECDVIIVDGVDSMKKNKKNHRKGKPKKVEIVIGEVEHVKEVAVNENMPARRMGEQTVWLPKMEDVSEKFRDFSVDGRNVEGRERATLGFEKNGGKNTDSGQVWKIKEQIGGKMGDFSVNRRKGKSREMARLGFNRNGGGNKSVDSDQIEDKMVEDEEKIGCFPVNKRNEEGTERNGGARHKGSRNFRNGGGGRNVGSGKISEAKEKVTKKMEEFDEQLGNPSVIEELESNGGDCARDMPFRRFCGGSGRNVDSGRFRSGGSERNVDSGRFRGGGSGRNVDSGRFRGGDGKNVDSEKFYGDGLNRRGRTQREVNFVWVKKDEVSDGNVASIS